MRSRQVRSHALPRRPRRTMPGMRPPSIDAILRAADGALTGRDRAAVVAEARAITAEERARLASGDEATSVQDLARQLADRLAILGDPALGGDDRAALRPAINATGVILHTNLGRAAWPAAAIEAARQAAGGASL